MQPEVLKLLNDISNCITEINEFLGTEASFTFYNKNKMLQKAVEREFEIIGEALNRLSKLEGSPGIKNQSKIIGLRNRVIHAYDAVDNHIIWGIIQRHLPLLEQEINTLISQSKK